VTSKVRTLGDAIATHVRDGACVALEGFTHLIPFAAGHEIIRQGRRNLHLARFADFEFLRPCPPADLLVCSDVLHYLPTRELERGLPALAELCGGVAFIEAFAREDEAVGDDHEFKPRPAAFYRTRLRALGLHPLGSHCWLSPGRVAAASALELPG